MQIDPLVSTMVSKLVDSAAEGLVSVFLYGPVAHGDYLTDKSNTNLLLVLSDLSLARLASIGEPVRWWLKKGAAMPRIFSPEFLEQAADVFPIEFLDLRSHHHLVHGRDVLEDLEVALIHLRSQCERELREKLMRLQEAYIESEGKPKLLETLLLESYPAFARVFRGCLYLQTEQIPTHDIEVVRLFCAQAELDAEPFAQIDAMKNESASESATGVEELFLKYYQQLIQAIQALNHFAVQNGDSP